MRFPTGLLAYHPAQIRIPYIYSKPAAAPASAGRFPASRSLSDFWELIACCHRALIALSGARRELVAPVALPGRRTEPRKRATRFYIVIVYKRAEGARQRASF